MVRTASLSETLDSISRTRQQRPAGLLRVAPRELQLVEDAVPDLELLLSIDPHGLYLEDSLDGLVVRGVKLGSIVEQLGHLGD